jgi:hypothetical protein
VKVMFQFRVGTPPELKSTYCIINSGVFNFISEKSKRQSYDGNSDLYQILK